MNITEVCAECRNYFAPANKKTDRSFIHTGEFTISGHTITPLDFIQSGQYFRIVGSTANDGVYCNTSEGLSVLTDETFDGSIWEMSVPRAFIEMCADIDAWRTKNESVDSANMSPFTAESFAGYSYQKGGGLSRGTGNALTWQSQFSSRLNAWRRLNVL
jgi:hypothetical protein